MKILSLQEPIESILKQFNSLSSITNLLPNPQLIEESKANNSINANADINPVGSPKQSKENQIIQYLSSYSDGMTYSKMRELLRNITPSSISVINHEFIQLQKLFNLKAKEADTYKANLLQAIASPNKALEIKVMQVIDTSKIYLQEATEGIISLQENLKFIDKMQTTKEQLYIDKINNLTSQISILTSQNESNVQQQLSMALAQISSLSDRNNELSFTINALTEKMQKQNSTNSNKLSSSPNKAVARASAFINTPSSSMPYEILNSQLKKEQNAYISST